MTNHERFEELIPIYALGALDGDDLREVEEHLESGCSVCEELLREEERIAFLLPYSVTAPPPSSSIKERVFEKIRTSEDVGERSYIPNSRNRIRPALWFGLGGVALALLVLLLASNLSLRNRLRNQEIEISSLRNQSTQQSENVESLRNNLAARESELKNVKEQVARQNEIAEFLQNPDVVVINLVGLQPDLKARGRVLWDTKHNEAFFYSLNLPAPPAEKTYQLWVIANNTPISAGIFNIDEKGDNVMKLKSLPSSTQIQKFAVTLEPDGGVPQPTGDMYLLGES